MHKIFALLLSLLAGVILGALFFGGLWWTVQKSISSKHPAALLFGSLIIRFSLTIAGFYFVSRGDWKRLFACVSGFLLARFFVTRLTAKPQETRNFPIEETHHAS